MRTFLTYCIFITQLVVGDYAMAQSSVASDINAMIKAIGKAENMHMIVDVKMEFDGKSPSEKMRIEMFKKGDDFFIKRKNKELFKTGNHFFMIDLYSKVINYYNIKSDEQYKSKKLEFNSMSYANQLDSMLKSVDTAYMASNYNGIKTFVFKQKNSEVLTSYLEMDASTHIIKNVKYLYDTDKSGGLSSVVINYTKIDMKPTFPEGFWDLTRVAKISSNNRIAPSAPYLNYQINLIPDVNEFIQ